MPIPLPNNYDSIEPEEFKPYVRPPAGGYVLKCTHAEEAISKEKQNPMIAFQFDISEGEFKDSFGEYPLKHWAVMTQEQMGRFKGVVKAFDDSNAHPIQYASKGAEKAIDAKSFIGKLVGANLREEEYNKDGEIKNALKISFLCGAERVRKGEIKPLPVKKLIPSSKASSNDGWNTPTTYDEMNPPPYDGEIPLPY